MRGSHSENAKNHAHTSALQRLWAAMSDELPDSKIPWWDNEYEGTYSDDPEDGYPYDMGTKVQE